MSDYDSSLTRIFPYKDRIEGRRFCPYTEKYGSEKVRILAYITLQYIEKLSFLSRIFYSVNYVKTLLFHVFTGGFNSFMTEAVII